MNKKEEIDYTVYLVTNNKNKTEEEFLNIIEEAIKGGTSIIQIREKTANTKAFYELAIKVKEITKKYNVPLVINDRIDLALAIDAEGVHIGQDDMPAKVAREIIGPNKILGVSAATIDEAKQAEVDGADYIGTGAVFQTSTKNDASTITKEELKYIVQSINIPTVAIGGISLDNAKELIDTEIAGFSVVSAIMESNNPKEASEKLRKIYENS